MIAPGALDPEIPDPACELEAFVAAAQAKSVAGASSSHELVLVPGEESRSATERAAEERSFESPLLNPQTVASMLEMSQRVTTYTKVRFLLFRWLCLIGLWS